MENNDHWLEDDDNNMMEISESFDDQLNSEYYVISAGKKKPWTVIRTFQKTRREKNSTPSMIISNIIQEKFVLEWKMFQFVIFFLHDLNFSYAVTSTIWYLSSSSLMINMISLNKHDDQYKKSVTFEPHPVNLSENSWKVT